MEDFEKERISHGLLLSYTGHVWYDNTIVRAPRDETKVFSSRL